MTNSPPPAFSYDPATHMVQPSRSAEGPWSPGFQHGGAPSSLSIWAAEQLATLVPMEVASVTVDLMRPVPTTPLMIDAKIVREGKKLQLCSVELLSEGIAVSRARILKMRVSADRVPGDLASRPTGITWPADKEGLPDFHHSGFSRLHDIRQISGGFRKPGPGQAWFLTEGEIVGGHPVSPAMRVAAAADFGNGVSSNLPFADWLFLNADLSLTLARLPRDHWILLDACTEVDDYGRGVTLTRIGDKHGWIGHATQTLLLERR